MCQNMTMLWLNLTPKETSFRSRSKEGEQGREEKEATRQERPNTERKKKRKKEWRQ